MNNEIRIRYLRRVLALKVFVTIFVWGLPSLIAPLSFLSVLDIPIPVEQIYLRLFGGAAVAWGIAYWFAFKDPLANIAILRAGLVDNALPTLAIFWLGITGQHSSLFIWISGLLTAFFFFAFLILTPSQEHPR